MTRSQESSCNETQHPEDRYTGVTNELDEIKKERDELALINKLTRILTSDSDITKTFEAFALKLGEVVPFDYIFITTKEVGRVRFLALFSKVPPIFAEDGLPLRGSVLEWIIENRKTNIEEDFLRQKQFAVDDIYLRNGLRSAIRVPLMRKDKVFGSLNLTSSEANTYTESHKKLLEDLAAHIADNIHNAHLCQVERILSESAADIILTMDLDGNITYVSKTDDKETGYVREDILGRNIRDILTPESYELALERIKRRIEGARELSPYEVGVKTKDGRVVPFELNTSPLIRYGELDATQIVARNISKRKQDEEKLRESEERYRLLFQNTPAAVAQVDKNGRFLTANPAMADNFGMSSEELTGKTFFDTMPQDVARHRLEMVRKAIESGQTQIFEDEREGEYRYNIFAPMKIPGQEDSVLVIARDITAQKQELKRRTNLINSLAHEMRTPLTPVLSSAKLLVSELETGDGDKLKLARNILAGACTLSERLDEFLELAKGEAGLIKVNPELFDIESLIVDIREQFLPLFTAKKQKLEIEISKPLPKVLADEKHIRQVLSNLLSNANKFTPEGGHITLRAGKKDNTLVVEVEDNGPGISPERQNTLFQPYSPWGSFSGLGLGLAISKELIELQNGKIWCQNKLGEGSTFGFSLPLAIEER